MPLAWSKRHLLILAFAGRGVHCVAIEEDVVAWGSAVGLSIVDQVVCGFVVIVRQDHRSKINVIRRACRPVDLDGANDAVAVLG